MGVGMADWSGYKGTHGSKHKGQIAPDFDKALRTMPGGNNGTSQEDAPIPSSHLPMIMMQHQPKGMIDAAKAGVGLQLSGHTHGGQLWPQHMFLMQYDSISGLKEFDVGSPEGPSYLFVSEGIVGWGPRLRFLSKCDLALLTLRSPEAMKAEGLEPDTHMTLATGAMYFAAVVGPVSVFACMVPLFCWIKQFCRY